jgi:hypothetical protein
MGARVIQGYFTGGRPRPATASDPAALGPPASDATRANIRPHAVHLQRIAQMKVGDGHGAPTPRAPAVRRSGQGEAFQLPAQLANLGGGAGQPLPGAVRQAMESFFQTSFADVRVHIGAQAGAIGAVAFTQAPNLYFAPGQYNPHTGPGRRLIGHELAHVVQQRAGRVRNPFGGGTAVVHDPALEAEADRLGQRAAAHTASPAGRVGAPQSFALAPRVTYSALPIQRRKTVLTVDEERVYDACKERGKRIMAAIAAKKVAIAQGAGAGSAAVLARFQAEYVTEVTDKTKGVYQVTSKARASAEGVEFHYKNGFDMKTKKVTAKQNHKFDVDVAPPRLLDLTPNCLNNSEIIWCQYIRASEAYRTARGAALAPGSAEALKMLKVKELVRHNVTNKETKDVVEMAFPNNKSWTTHKQTWKPPSDEFHAVLGTPNAQAAGYMLAGHMDEMEGRARKITGITAGKNSEGGLDLVIKLERD